MSQHPTSSAHSEGERNVYAEAQIASIASPIALGFAAFALPLFMWGVINADFFSQSERFFLIPVALVYGGLAQLAASMWSFRKHDGLLAITFGSYGAFWLTFGTLLWMQHGGFLAYSGSTERNLLGLFFLAWAVPMTYLWAASVARAHWAMSAALIAGAASFWLVMIAYYADSSAWMQVGGWVAIAAAVIGWYTSAAEVINHTVAKMVLPTHRAALGTDLERLEGHPENLI